MTLEQIILSRLALVAPRMLTVPVLHGECRMHSAEPVSLGDLEHTIDVLESKRQVTVASTEDVTKVRIAPDGVARYREMG